jgi:hypothetical protein
MGLRYAARRLSFRRRYPSFADLQDAKVDPRRICGEMGTLSRLGADGLRELVPAHVQVLHLTEWVSRFRSQIEEAPLSEDEVSMALGLGYASVRAITGKDFRRRPPEDLAALSDLRALVLELRAAEQEIEMGAVGTKVAACIANRIVGDIPTTDPRFIVVLILVLGAQALAAMEEALARTDKYEIG